MYHRNQISIEVQTFKFLPKDFMYISSRVSYVHEVLSESFQTVFGVAGGKMVWSFANRW
jgi:hypothetical protein